MQKPTKFAISPALLAFVGLGLVACNGEGGAPGPVCDPLGNAQTQALGPDYGLKATLFEIARNLPANTTVSYAQTNGRKNTAQIYLGDINVPTQHFNEGFIGDNGEPVTLPDGSLLSAFFALHIESQLTLAKGDAPGAYQFALYSDDGSVLKLDTGSGLRTIVDNDGTHESKLEISTSPVTLQPGDKLPLVVDYMQGAPDYLSVVLLWRPWPGNGSGDSSDPATGLILPHEFWDTDQVPSVPKQRWNDLLARGWTVVRPENFKLAEPNPCQ